MALRQIEAGEATEEFLIANGLILPSRQGQRNTEFKKKLKLAQAKT